MKSAVKIWREQKERLEQLDKVGRVVSWTRILEAPAGFEGVYIVVMVEMRKGKRVVGELIGEKEPEFGVRVKGVLRRIGRGDKDGVIEYGVKFKLI